MEWLLLPVFILIMYLSERLDRSIEKDRDEHESKMRATDGYR